MVLWRPTRPSRTNTKKKDVLFIIGDWNAKVGSQEIPGATDKFGLGVQNEAGQRLIEFCQENTLVMANTLFQQHKRSLYTGTSPHDQYQNQIDIYIYMLFHIFSIWFTMEYWIYFPVLYSRTLFFIHSTYNSLHLLIPELPIHLSPAPTPPWQPQVCSSCLWVFFYFIDKSNCVIFY